MVVRRNPVDIKNLILPQMPITENRSATITTEPSISVHQTPIIGLCCRTKTLYLIWGWNAWTVTPYDVKCCNNKIYTYTDSKIFKYDFSRNRRLAQWAQGLVVHLLRFVVLLCHAFDTLMNLFVMRSYIIAFSSSVNWDYLDATLNKVVFQSW